MDRFSNVLEKEMDRGEFLRHIGLAVMTLVGSNLIVRAIFSHSAPAKQRVQARTPQGYGSSAYGGARR